MWSGLLLYSVLCTGTAYAFSSSRNDNLAVYWGQDGAGRQQRLGFYCNDDTIDTFPLAFLHTFFGKNGAPIVDFSNICSQGGCAFLASDIQKCQAKGKIITISLGGAISKVGFQSSGQAVTFARTVWDMFLGGNGQFRPLGGAILDGVDLDIESGSSAHYGTFVNAIRSLAQNSKKRFYVTAAPQCPFPDQWMGEALNTAPFDAIYVQFYNNYCETSRPSAFNFATWDNWAKTRSLNKNVKIYIGAPGSPKAAGSGYVGPQALIAAARDAQRKYPSFGGVMLWDADSAYHNNQFHVAVKRGIRTAGGPRTDSPNPNIPITTRKPTSTSTPTPIIVGPDDQDPLLTMSLRKPGKYRTLALREAGPEPTG